jgi:hypothetical protein
MRGLGSYPRCVFVIGCALVAVPAFAQSNDPGEAIKEIDSLEQQAFRPGNASKANQELAKYCAKINARLRGGLDRATWEPVVRHCSEVARRVSQYNSGGAAGTAGSGTAGGGATAGGPGTGTTQRGRETPTVQRHIAAGRPTIPNVTVPPVPKFCSEEALQAWVNSQIRPRLNELQSALNALQNYNSQLYDEKWYSKPPATPAELNQIAAAQKWHDEEVAKLQARFDQILDLWRNAKVVDCGEKRGAQRANTPGVWYVGGNIGVGSQGTNFSVDPPFTVYGSGPIYGGFGGMLFPIPNSNLQLGFRLGWEGSNLTGKVESPPASPLFDYRVRTSSTFYQDALVKFSTPFALPSTFFTGSIGIAEMQTSVNGTSGIFSVTDGAYRAGPTFTAGIGTLLGTLPNGAGVEGFVQWRGSVLGGTVSIPGSVPFGSFTNEVDVGINLWSRSGFRLWEPEAP